MATTATKTVTIGSIIGAILTSVIFVEGDFSDDPFDAGGATKYGITEKVARECGYKGDMKDLSLVQANEIYTALYVKGPHFDKVVEQSPAVAHKLIDAGVNVGTMRVSKWFQESLNKLSRGGVDYPKVSEDGVIGVKTLEAYSALEKLRGKEQACTLMIKSLDALQGNYYLSLTKHYRYTVGWMDKRVGNIPLSQCKEYNLVLPVTANTYENF